MPGIGRRLLEYGAEHYGIREVTVNEQNPQAGGFYEHMGFVTYKRTDRDEQAGRTRCCICGGRDILKARQKSGAERLCGHGRKTGYEHYGLSGRERGQ